MSSNQENGDLESFIKSPRGWIFGAITSVIAVAGAVFLDPTGAVATILLTLISQASLIFTGLSITGFTLAPEIPQLPARPIQIAAIVFGIIFVAQIVDKVWDRLKDRVDDD